MMRQYPDLGRGSDWLKQISITAQPISQKHFADLGSDTSSVWNFCRRSSGAISGGFAKYRLFSLTTLDVRYHE